MTKEEELDWLCRLRSEIYVYMPKEWLIPMNNALDMAISALSENKGEFDGMNNGEVIQALFPNAVIHNDDSMLIKEVLFTSEMWNAPYQKGGEDQE